MLPWWTSFINLSGECEDPKIEFRCTHPDGGHSCLNSYWGINAPAFSFCFGMGATNFNSKGPQGYYSFHYLVPFF